MTYTNRVSYVRTVGAEFPLTRIRPYGCSYRMAMCQYCRTREQFPPRTDFTMSSSATDLSSIAANNSTKKRKRPYSTTKRIASHDDGSDDHDAGTNPTKVAKTTTLTLFLKGMTLAISTMEDKKHNADNDNNDNDRRRSLWSYKAVQKLGIELGARVSGQVHRAVTLLLCTPSALRDPATQRVRKAIRHGIPLVHVQWLFDCQEQNMCLEFRDYVLDAKSSCETGDNHKSEKALRLMATTSTARTLIDDCNEIDDSIKSVEVTGEDVSGAGWTPAEDLGCCCVCHESESAHQCPWCAECSVTTGNAAAGKN